MSTGIELQVLMPVVNAPFRVYWAYNPLRVNTNLLPPQVVGPSYFPNQATYQNYLLYISGDHPLQRQAFIVQVFHRADILTESVEARE